MSCPSRGAAGADVLRPMGRAASDQVFNDKSETEINNDSF
jgi:hypothetical protein